MAFDTEITVLPPSASLRHVRVSPIGAPVRRITLSRRERLPASARFQPSAYSAAVWVRFSTDGSLTLVDRYERANERLHELAQLDQGWLDGDGEAIAPAALRLARAALRSLAHAGAPPPRIYPTPEGGVQAEWSIAPWAIEALFGPDDTTPEELLRDVAAGTDATTFTALNLQTRERWSQILPTYALPGALVRLSSQSDTPRLGSEIDG
jgi:hypothetical protein